MTKLLTILAIAAAPAFAYDFPILVKSLGGLDKKDGVLNTKNCEVFDDSKAIKLADVLKLAGEAEKEKMNKALHSHRQVPSEEIWVNIPMRKAGGPGTTLVAPHKVPLLSDASTMDIRNGAAAEELLKLVESICKD